MNHLGKSFRLARQAKGFTQKYVAEGIISLPALSKFETGKAMVAADKFHRLLDRLAISYKEFEVSFMDTGVGHQDEFLSSLSDSITTQNAYSLEQQIIWEYKLYESNQTIQHYHNYLLATLYRAHYFGQGIEDQPLQQLFDYLVDRNEWGSYEIVLFGNLVPFLSERKISSLSKKLMSRSLRLFQLPRFKVDIINIYLNICHRFIQAQNFDQAYLHLKECKSLVDSVPYINEKNRFRYTKGIYLMHTDRFEQGLKMAQASIAVYGEFDLSNRAKILSQELEEYIRNLKEFDGLN